MVKNVFCKIFIFCSEQHMHQNYCSYATFWLPNTCWYRFFYSK